MIFTNRLNLPQAVIRALENDPYSKDGADFTSTQLAEPPRAEAIKHLYPDRLQIDASSRCRSLLGQGIHNILERGARDGIDIVEKRFFWTFNKIKVGGKIDLYETDTQTLYEYKSCLAEAFSKKKGGGNKPEWVAQASVNRLLMELNHIHVKRVVVIGWLTDWREWMVSDGYPEASVMPVEIEPWSRVKTMLYIEERLLLHMAARMALPSCSSRETWGGSRCKNYCEAAKACTQYQEAKKTGLIEKKESP